MCELKGARFNNVVVNQNSSSEEVTQRNKMVAGGLIFEQDRGVFKVDVAYQTSRSVTENFNAEVGQRVPTVFVEFDDNDGPSFTLDPSIPLRSENVSLRNSINQNFSAGEGSLFQEIGRASCRERVCPYV